MNGFVKTALCSAVILSLSGLSAHAASIENQNISDKHAVYETLPETSKGGAAVLDNDLVISGSTFNNNSVIITFDYSNEEETFTDARGGAVYSGNSVEIDNSIFTNNVASVTKFNPSKANWGLGGAVFIGGWSGSITNSVFSSNKAESGGAIGSINAENAWKDAGLYIENTSFENNEGTKSGGAIAFYEKLSIENSSFVNNKVTADDDDGGGAIVLGGHAKVSINGTLFQGNSSASIGGAIATRPVDTNRGATNSYGGAWMDISNSQFISNSAVGENNTSHYYGRGTGVGGAIYLGMLGEDWTGESGILRPNTIVDTVFSGNTASKSGGAIYTEGNLKISGSTVFENNKAGEQGGAIYIAFARTTLNADQGDVIRFSGNTAGERANDIYIAKDSEISITGSTPQNYADEVALSFEGNGTILLEGGIAGDNSGKIYSSGADVRVGSIADFAGELSVTDGEFTLGDGVVNGSVNVTGGVFNALKGITFAEESTGTVTLNGGTIATTMASVFTDTTLNSRFTLTEGTLNFGADELSTSWLTSVSGSYSNVIFASSNVVDGEGEAITEVGTDDLQSGLIYSGATLTGTGDAITVTTTNTGVQTIASTEAVKTVSLGSNFTLVGDGQKIVQNEAAGGTAITASGDVHLGLQGAAGGGELEGSVTTTNNGNVFVDASNFTVGSVTSAGRVEVAHGASLTTDALEFTTDSTVSGSLYAGSISSTAGLTVAKDGFVSFDTTDAAITLESGSTLAIGKLAEEEQPAEPPVEEGGEQAGEGGAAAANGIALFSVTTPADGQVNNMIDASAADTIVTVGGGSEAAFKAALADAGVEYDETKNSGIYFADTLKLDANGAVQVAYNAGATGAVMIGADGIAVIDAQRFMNTADAVIEGDVVLNGSAQVVLSGLDGKGTMTLATGWRNDDGSNHVVDWEDGNVLFNEALEIPTTGDNEGAVLINVTTNQNAFNGDEELYKLVDENLGADANAGTRNVLTAIGRHDSGLVDVASDTLTSRGEDAIAEYFAMPVTAGTYNVAYDAAEQVTGTVQRRNLEPSTGLGVWADVFYASNEAKKLYDGQGYSADIYGGTIGFDGTFSCGAKLGLALSVGSGDADSEKSVGKYSNDADFWGVTLYTGKAVGDTGLYISADASYLWLDNDIDGHVAGASVAESIDSNVFTVGVRADMTVYDQAVKVIPHVGVRYTNIDVDDYRGLESDGLNVVELPIGVKVAGDFEPAAGWTLTPSFDFTVVPQVGDKDVNTLVGDVDVIDNVYNSTLGVKATYGNFAFGLSYRYGFGNDDRSNNAFQARASWQF